MVFVSLFGHIPQLAKEDICEKDVVESISGVPLFAGIGRIIQDTPKKKKYNYRSRKVKGLVFFIVCTGFPNPCPNIVSHVDKGRGLGDIRRELALLATFRDLFIQLPESPLNGLGVHRLRNLGKLVCI
jgi:hypothetical protein